MRELLRHLVVGGLTAILLAWGRGGFGDAPWVLVFFGLIGFLGSLAISYVLEAGSQNRIDARLGSSARARTLRQIASLAFAASLFFWTGPAILAAGAGGWLLFVGLGLAAPLAVGLVAPSWHLAWGAGVATAIALSLWRANLQRPWGHVETVAEVLPAYAAVWLIAVGLAAVSAIPRSRHRRRVAAAGRRIGAAVI